MHEDKAGMYGVLTQAEHHQRENGDYQISKNNSVLSLFVPFPMTEKNLNWLKREGCESAKHPQFSNRGSGLAVPENLTQAPPNDPFKN